MLRRSILALLVPLLLAVGLLAATPATPATAAPVYDNSIGIIRVPDQVLRQGCGYYRLNWRFHPPTSGWTVTARIRAPRGFDAVSQFWDSNSKSAGTSDNLSRKRGHLRFQLCRPSVRPGRYKIEMTMIYSIDDRHTRTVRRAPTYFRMLRPS